MGLKLRAGYNSFVFAPLKVDAVGPRKDSDASFVLLWACPTPIEFRVSLRTGGQERMTSSAATETETS